jgi:peptidoglycan/xylan/chitin deacetylase (PgdA/CDA1 family)
MAAARGHEVGNHTRSHARLGEIDEARQVAEIRGAAEMLVRENLAGGSFCLPYGSYSDCTESVLRLADVTVAMSVRKAVATDADNRLLLPRIFVAYGDALPMLLYRIYIRPHIPKRRRM